MRTLVTGGAGFIGSHVTRTLPGTVHVIDDCSTGHEEHLPETATIQRVDITDAAAVSAAVAAFDPERIIHLAAMHYIPDCNADPERAFEVNVMGTRNLLDAARELDGLESVVFTSTAAVYPSDESAHAEADATGPMDIYGRTKLVCEDLCRLFHRDTGVPTTAARLFNVYGPNETNPHLIPAILDQLDAVPIELGNLAPKRDFVHVTDVARALVTMAEENDGYSTYNVGSGRAYSVQEVAEAVCEAADREPAVEQASDRIRESDRPHLQADISKISTGLRWRPEVAFVAGLRELV